MNEVSFVREHLERRARVDELERLRTYFTEAEALGRLGVFELAPDGDATVRGLVQDVTDRQAQEPELEPGMAVRGRYRSSIGTNSASFAPV